MESKSGWDSCSARVSRFVVVKCFQRGGGAGKGASGISGGMRFC